jgi:hypothetical protein
MTYVRTIMSDQAARSRTWKRAWIVAGTGLVAWDVTQAATAANATDRTDAIVGAAASALIPISIALGPPRVIEGDEDLSAPASGSGDLCSDLAHAEALLVQASEDQMSRKSTRAHAINIGFNAVIGLTLAAFGHWKGALANGLGGIVIGETLILTQPSGATGGLQKYRSGNLGGDASSGASARWLAAPLITPVMAGVRLCFEF